MPKYPSPYRYRYCAICGKYFAVMPGTIYKLTFIGKTQHFCSYSCYLEGKRTKESVNESQYAKLTK